MSQRLSRNHERRIADRSARCRKLAGRSTTTLRFASRPYAVIALTSVLLIGCGGSSEKSSSVVTPPEPSNLQDSSSNPPENPPGELVLPPGQIPADDDTDATPSPEKEGGFEMPPAGAASTAPDTTKQSGTGEPSETSPSEAAGGSGSPIQYATWEEIQQRVTTTGQVTVVDLWSLACEPCLKEFPGLVRLHQTYGDSVTCVAVDMDYDGRESRPPEYYEPRVADFLQSVGADFTTYISRTPNEEIYAATDIDSIPAVLIFDQQGKIVKVFADTGETQGFSYEEDIIPLVAKMAG